ncbi:MAG: hypothetical protein AUJ58_05615 [Zetaproteobacteria bacterium CG1_02_55_237]|nr:MAG: hypothetical protein AUJ58_05615 [Zetaproteobacteria bacterium CG1_02_55_237]
MANLTRKPRDLWRQHVLPWYQHLQQREQRLVLGTSVILPLLIVVFGMWLPLRDEAMQISSTMPELQAQLLEAQLLADKVAKGGVKSAAQGDLLTVVDTAARGSNIRQFITRIKPQLGVSGQSVLVQLRKAPYADTVRFFTQMANQGVSTERAKLSDVEANGLVDVDITFSLD